MGDKLPKSPEQASNARVKENPQQPKGVRLFLPEGDYIDAVRAAEMLDIHPALVRRYFKEGRLPGIRIMKIWLTTETEVQKFSLIPRKPGPQRKKLS